MGDTTLKDTDYTVTFSNNIDVGTAQIKVVGKGKYKNSKTSTFEISPAEISGITTTPVNVDYNGLPHSINIGGLVDESEITYATEEEGEYTSINPEFINSGHYTVYFKITKANHILFTGRGTVTINKIAINIETLPTPSSVVAYNFLSSSTLTGGVVSPNVDGTFQWEENAKTQQLEYNDSENTEFNIKFVPTDSVNYIVAVGKIKITVTQIVPTVEVDRLPSFIKLTPNIDIRNIPLNYIVDEDIEGTISFRGDQQLVAGNNLYEWVFVPLNNNYATCKGTMALEVDGSSELESISIGSSQPYVDNAKTTLSKLNILVNATYKNADGSTTTTKVNFWNADYNNDYGYLIVGQGPVSINYLGFTTPLEVIVNPIEFSTQDIEIEYIGPTEYYDGFQLLAEHFLIENFEGTIELENINIETTGSSVSITFIPHNWELFYKTNSNFEITYDFNLYMYHLLTNVYIDNQLVEFDLIYKYTQFFIKDDTVDIKINFDNTLYEVYLEYSEKMFELENGIAKTIKTDFDDYLFLYVYEIYTDNEIDFYIINLIEEDYIENITYTHSESEQFLNFEVYTNNKVPTEYYTYLSTEIFTGIQIEMKEGYTYQLSFEEEIFDINNLHLGDNLIKLKIFSQGVLIQTREIWIEYEYQDTILAISSGEDNFSIETMEIKYNIRYYVEGFFEEGEFTLENLGENNIELYSLDNIKYNELPTLLSWVNKFIVKIIYPDGITNRTLSFQLYIYNQSINISDYIEKVEINLGNQYFYFQYFGNYTNTLPIHRYYDIEQLEENLEITTTSFFNSQGYTINTLIMEDSIKCTIMDGENVFHEFIIEINYRGEVNNDTTLYYKAFNDYVQISYNQLYNNTTITIVEDSEVYFYFEYFVNINITSDNVDDEFEIYDYFIYFYNAGTFQVTIEVTASDKITTEIFTITFVVEKLNLLNIKFLNGEVITLPMNFMFFEFGNFQLQDYNEASHTMEFVLFKVFPTSKLEDFITNNKMIVDIFSHIDLEDKLLIDNKVVDKFSNVELVLTTNDDEEYYNLECIMILEDEVFIINIKILFLDMEPILTFKATMDDITTTKQFAKYGASLVGDFVEDYIFEYIIDMSHTTEVFQEGQSYSINIDIELAEGFYLYDFYTEEQIMSGLSVPIIVDLEEGEYIGNLLLSHCDLEEINEFIFPYFPLRIIIKF